MYKSKLQELCQRRRWMLPEYTTTKVGLDHNPRFSANVTFNGQTFATVEFCRSSKDAQNEAAKLAFAHFSDLQPKPTNPIPSPSSFPQPSLPASSALPSTVDTDLNSTHDTKETLQPKIQETPHVPIQGNGSTLEAADGNRFGDIQHLYKNQLQTYAQKRNLLLPVYSCEREGPPHSCRFKCRVTIDGQTYEGQEFLPSVKEAEHAVAKDALMSLFPDGVQEEDSGLYKNLLQELIQKEGFSVPTYITKPYGQLHMRIFVSTVEIEGEPFTGSEARSKKQAETGAAKVAYLTLRERKSSQIPLFRSTAGQGQEASEILTSSFHSNLASDLQQQGGPNAPANLIPKTIIQEQTKDDSVAAKGSNHHDTTVSSRPEALTAGGRFSSSDIVHGRDQETNNSAPPVSQNGLSSKSPYGCSTNIVMDPTLEPPAKRSMSSYKKVSVYPRKPNMTFPEGTTVLSMSDEKWVALSHT